MSLEFLQLLNSRKLSMSTEFLKRKMFVDTILSDEKTIVWYCRCILGFFSMAFANTMIGFDVANWCLFLLPSQFGPGRALISKSVGADEIGKVNKNLLLIP